METHQDVVHFTADQYNQLENFLMEGREFRLPESNPSPFQQDESNQDEITRDANSGDDVTNGQHMISPTGFSDHMEQPKNEGLVLSDNNSMSSLKRTYKIKTFSPVQPVGWSSPAQISSFAKTAGDTSSPNPLPTSPTSAHLMSNSTALSGQSSTSPISSASASTQQFQIINPPPPMHVPPPPQAPCNNNKNGSDNNYAQHSTGNDTHLQQGQHIRSNEEGYDDQLVAPPYYPYNSTPAIVDGQPVANKTSSSSSIASRFTAATQGASMGNMRSTRHDPSLPCDAPPAQHCAAYVQGSAQMDAGRSGYGAVQTPFPPQMAVAGGGGLETGLLSMYTSASFHDFSLMAAQRCNNKNNNSAATKKQQRQEVTVTKNRRGRPKGSVSKKRNPAPQWEDVQYDLHELEQHAKKPYNVRRAEWQDLKQAGALATASRAQMTMSNTLPAGGDQMSAFDAGWNNYALPMNNNNNTSNYYDMQGQNGDLAAVGIPSPSNYPPTVADNSNPTPNHVLSQPPTAQSEAEHSVPPSCRQGCVTTFGDAAPFSADNIGMAPVSAADKSPSKFWSFGTNNPPGTIQNANNNSDDQNMIITNPGIVEAKENQAIENHEGLLQSGSSGALSVEPVAAAPSQNNSCVELGTAGSSSNNDQDQSERGTNINNNPVNHVGGMMRGSFSNSGSHESTMMEPPAVVAAANNNNQFWCGHHQSTYGVTVQGQGRATNSEGPTRTAASTAPSSYETAAASTQITAVKSNYSNNPSVNHNASVEPTLMPSAINLVTVADQFSISVSDYFSEYDGMQLTDEDYIACALREQIIAQPTAQPIQHQQHITLLPTLHHPMPCGVIAEQQANAQQIAQAPATPVLPQPMQSVVAAGQQVAFSGSNNQLFNMYSPSQPNFQQNPFTQYQSVQDGRGSGHQVYMQQSNTHNNANNAAIGHQQVPTAYQTTRHQNIPQISGPTDFFYYQQRLGQQQQQTDSSVNGPRPYAMPPPPGSQSGYMINTPLMQQHFYQCGGNGDLRPPKPTRRRQTQPPHYPVIDFNQCAVTPSMFNEIVDEGSMDSVLGSDLWAGLDQEAYNIMVTADPTLLLDPGRLQERIAQINSGMLPIPNMLNALRMNSEGYSAPQAAKRLMHNDTMMNCAPPNAMQPNPTARQGHGLATGAANYNFPDPYARAPQLMMNANNIPSVQNQQQSNNLQVVQINANMQQGHPNFRYWHEYPAAPSSSQRLEEMLQLVPVNQLSVRENLNYNTSFSSSLASGIIPQLQHAARSPNTLQAPNQAYNNAMYGVPYTSEGPPYLAQSNEK